MLILTLLSSHVSSSGTYMDGDDDDEVIEYPVMLVVNINVKA